MTRTRLVRPSEVRELLELAREFSVPFSGLDVGKDYVRLLPGGEGRDDVEQYVRPTRRPQKVAGR